MDNIRLSNLKKLLQENGLGAVLISSLPNIIHLTNFSYFTDIEREGFLLITEKKQYILTDSRYSHAVRTQLKTFELLELNIQTPLTFHIKNILDNENISLLGLEENNLTVTEHKKIKSVIKKIQHIDLHPMRIIKTNDEIKMIKQACNICDKAFSYITKQFKSGMTEKEIAFLLETFIKKNGGEPSFPSIVAFGENAAVPHHKTGNKKLKKDSLVLLDFGVKYENYCSDMTRTVFFGKATEEQKKVYEIVRTAQQKAREQFNNGTIKGFKASAIDYAARQYIISNCYPSIPHSLGHGIGLQVHEAPSISPQSKYELTEGMVFSIEPGIYLNDKFGIRIEDLFAIQKGKLIQLTKSPRNLIEI